MSDERATGATLNDLPFYKVERVEEGIMVECPHCENGMILHEETWLEGAGDDAKRSTRVCPYCGEEAQVMKP